MKGQKLLGHLERAQGGNAGAQQHAGGAVQARTIEWFTKAFEPVLMAVLGLAIGGVVVLMYMPIFELAGSIR